MAAIISCRSKAWATSTTVLHHSADPNSVFLPALVENMDSMRDVVTNVAQPTDKARLSSCPKTMELFEPLLI